MCYLNRILILIFSISLVGQAAAQDLKLKQTLVLSGGTFEQSPPYQDRASVAFYKPDNQSYEFADSIYVESVQDAVIKGDNAYLAAEDSLIKYDLQNYKRDEIQTFEKSTFLSINGNKLLAGNRQGFAPDPELPFVNGWTIPGLDSTLTAPTDSLYEGLGDALIHNDKLYISHNIGKVNAFSDSLGFLAVYDLQNEKFEKNHRLYDTGAGIGELFYHNGNILGICGRNGQIMSLDIQSEQITYNNYSLSGTIGVFDDKLYGYNFSNEIIAYDITTEQTQNTGIQFSSSQNNSVNAFNYDTLNDQFYIAQTNFFDTGFLQIYNADGSLDTAFPTNVSPNSIAFDYFIDERPKAQNDYDTLKGKESKQISVLDNDTDPEGESLSLTSIVKSANNGVDSIAGNAVYYQAINTNYEDTIAYEVCDPGNQCDTGYLYIQVDANQAPVARADYDTLKGKESKQISVLDNDTDPEGESLSLTSIVKSANNGVDSIAGNAVYYQAINTNYEDTIAYEVCDPGNQCDTGYLYIQVEANQAPVARADYDTLMVNESKSIAVLGNDSDPDNDSLSLTAIIDSASKAKDSIAGDEIHVSATATGEDSITYEVCDGNEACDTGKVYLFISATIGMQDEVNKSAIHVYPNPANQTINLNVTENVDSRFDVTIFSSNGQTLINENNQVFHRGNKRDWNIEDWETGVYFIRLQNDDQTITKKFIKE